MQKCNQDYLSEGIHLYLRRLKHYHPIEWLELQGTKKISDIAQIKAEESKRFMKYLKPGDRLILLDEQGTEFSSKKLALKMESWLNQSGRLVFFIGGAYGFSDEIYQKADFKLSLSKLTFPHQLIRLFFLEQLYRIFSIINHESYHHE